MKVYRTNIEKSKLMSKYLPSDYSDTFKCIFTIDKNISADDLMIAFWTKNPKWLNRLFSLRDFLVRPFGIQSSKNRDKDLFEKAIRNSSYYKFVHVADNIE